MGVTAGAGMKGSGGADYLDTSPRTEVTADAPGCWRCTWVSFPVPALDGAPRYRHRLKAVHGGCELHADLKRVS